MIRALLPTMLLAVMFTPRSALLAQNSQVIVFSEPGFPVADSTAPVARQLAALFPARQSSEPINSIAHSPRIPLLYLCSLMVRHFRRRVGLRSKIFWIAEEIFLFLGEGRSRVRRIVTRQDGISVITASGLSDG